MDSFLEFATTRIIPALDAGLWTSILLIIPSSLLGVAIGVTVGTARVYAPRPVVRILEWYVSLFRGTPLVVQLYFWYFALPYVSIGDFRLILSPMWSAIIGFALCSGAYQSEYIRGGLLSIKRGQLRAAQALGMTPSAIVGSVLLESAVILALGVVFGSLLGFATVALLGHTGIDLSALSAGAEMWGIPRILYPEIAMKDVLAAGAVVMVLGVLVSLYPALKAARVTPVEAMHMH